MGARLGFHANLNARGLNREVPMIVFFTVANHSGFGLALQDFRLSPTPERKLEGVVWGFEVAADNLSAAADEAEKQKLRWERVADYRRQPLKSRCRPDPTATPWTFGRKPIGLNPATGAHSAPPHQPRAPRSDRSCSSAFLV